jgi:glyceraldehyde 3-phosphate dehydrogenase
MIKIGINGFGRIGRAFFRINLRHKKYQIVAINDIDPDVNNLAYLLKYDTTYGKLLDDKVEVYDGNLVVNGVNSKVFCKKEINNVPWSELGVDVVIDSSGVQSNVMAGRDVVASGVKKVIVTHSPKEGVDITLMKGVNESSYDKSKHHVISSSICDANAVAPFYKAINDAFGVELGEITTLHPWLSYQNLLDGTIRSVSSPGHYWSDYALGRSSIGSLIPKDTTLVKALTKVIDGIDENVHSSSFRTPTAIVSAADGVFLLKNKTTQEQVFEVLEAYDKKNPDVLQLDDRSLVSIDYLANEYAAVVDTRWLFLNKGKMLKFVLWYDNEWGYTKRAYNLTAFLLK